MSIEKFEYSLGKVLGSGTFGIVYEGCFKEKPDEKIAIKVIKITQTNIGKEIAILEKLHHENIVRLFNHSIEPDGVYLFMEYCNGGDLAKVLLDMGKLAEDDISNLVSQLSPALCFMNDQGIMHRDLKPANILLCVPSTDSKHGFDLIKFKVKYKLGDFGLARILEDGSMASTWCGSPNYMAPEVLLCKEYTRLVDNWSLGVIMYECLTGVVPFKAINQEALKAIYQKQLDQISFPPQTSKYLRDVIVKMLVKNPSNRISFKNIMQHPFVRGDITVDPPRKHSNFPTERKILQHPCYLSLQTNLNSERLKESNGNNRNTCITIFGRVYPVKFEKLGYGDRDNILIFMNPEELTKPYVARKLKEKGVKRKSGDL